MPRICHDDVESFKSRPHTITFCVSLSSSKVTRMHPPTTLKSELQSFKTSENGVVQQTIHDWSAIVSVALRSTISEMKRDICRKLRFFSYATSIQRPCLEKENSKKLSYRKQVARKQIFKRRGSGIHGNSFYREETFVTPFVVGGLA